MSVILIGNAKSVINYNFGPQIDQFDLVCRCNNYKIDGYEKNIGTKTNWIFCRSCSDITPKTNFDKIFPLITYCAISNPMRVVSKSLKRQYGEKCEAVDVYKTKKYHEKVGLDRTERLSVGCLAVCYLLDHFDNIVLHGFFEDRINNKIEKYWDQKCRDPQFHNWNKEREYIKGLSGITFLKDIQ